jgi:hypothetical protein
MNNKKVVYQVKKSSQTVDDSLILKEIFDYFKHVQYTTFSHQEIKSFLSNYTSDTTSIRPFS